MDHPVEERNIDTSKGSESANTIVMLLNAPETAKRIISEITRFRPDAFLTELSFVSKLLRKDLFPPSGRIHSAPGEFPLFCCRKKSWYGVRVAGMLLLQLLSRLTTAALFPSYFYPLSIATLCFLLVMYASSSAP
jgi:hypothetical protein